MNFHAAGTEFPAIQDIKNLVVDKGVTDTPKDQVGEVLYNHGVYNPMLIAEAIANAQKLSGQKVVTGEDVRRGFEAIEPRRGAAQGDGPGRLHRPAETELRRSQRPRPTLVQPGTARNGSRLADPAPPDDRRDQPLVEAAAKDYVEKNTGWPKRTEACDKSS